MTIDLGSLTRDYKEGMDGTELSRKYGYSMVTLRRVLKEHYVRLRPPGRPGVRVVENAVVGSRVVIQSPQLTAVAPTGQKTMGDVMRAIQQHERHMAEGSKFIAAVNKE